MINVEIAPADRKLRASNLDAGRAAHRAGHAASTLIEDVRVGKAAGDLEHRDRAGGVEQLEIGKDQHGNHDSASCLKMREIRHFRTPADHARMSPSSRHFVKEN